MPVEAFLIALGKTNRKLQMKAFAGIERLKSQIYHKEPFSKHLETGLWELRVKSETDILRIIILLHVFIKKQQKTPRTELEIARKRLKEIRLGEVN